MPECLLEPEVEILHGFGSYTRVINNGMVYEEGPVRAFVYLKTSNKSSIKVGFAVTRNITRAVDRNKLKRYLRVSFRLNTEIFRKNINMKRTIQVVFMYVGGSRGTIQKNVGFFTIAQAMDKICKKIEVSYD